MNRGWIALNKYLTASLLIAMLALLLLSPREARAATPAQSCNGQWNIVPSPSKDTLDTLNGIAAISPQDVWAVGRYVDTQNEALLEHWNGTQWSIVQGANLGSASSYLQAIAAVSSTDVWAFGGTSSGSLIEHWNGTSWSVVPNPGGGALYGASILSSSNIWAVGANNGQTLVEHWNGTQWGVIPSPNPGKYGAGFSAVSALSSTNIWAVGTYSPTEFGDQSLIEHWNGTQWSVVKSPAIGNDNELRAVAVISATDAWATGFYYPNQTNTLTLTEHWNGTTWSVVPSPSPYGDDGMFGVIAFATNNVWAVGDSSSADQNLVLHWNGMQWNIVPSPYPSGAISSFSAISADSPTDLWAAGFSINLRTSAFYTLVEHYCA